MSEMTQEKTYQVTMDKGMEITKNAHDSAAFDFSNRLDALAWRHHANHSRLPNNP